LLSRGEYRATDAVRTRARGPTQPRRVSTAATRLAREHADIEVFHKAAQWAVRHNELTRPEDAERALRRLVLWRKRCFGTHSDAGSRFVERVMTAVSTLRKQQRDVLETLTQSCTAALLGQSPPSLLPHSPPLST